MTAESSALTAPPLFVIGSPRSGTTWVHETLSAHPDVAGVFESWLLTTDTGLGALLKDRNWQWPHAGLAQFGTREEVVAQIRGFAEQLLAAGLEPGHRVVVEKSPHHRIPVITEIFPQARVIHCLRDGRDVAVSLRAAAGSWAPRWRHSIGRSSYGAARAWARAVDEVRRSQHLAGERFLEVRFEDMKADAPSVCRRMFEFAGLDHDEALVAAIVGATDFETRHAGGEGQFYRGGRTGDWETRMGLIDRVLFEAGSRGRLRAEGYAGRLWWARGSPRRGR